MENKDERFTCELCNVFAANEASINMHIAGKKHQLALHNKHLHDVREKYSIYVGGLPSAVEEDEILKLFSEYGEIVEHKLGKAKEYMLVQFNNEDVVKKLLTTPLSIKGNKLNIKRRTFDHYIHAPIKNKEPAESNENLLEPLKEMPDFKQQVDYIRSVCQPNWQEVSKKYTRLCRDLERCLQELFPGCVVHPFGSTITGLGFNDSDVDIYVQLRSQPNQLTPSTCVNKARLALLQYNRLFTQMRTIPKAKTPIVKCLHVPTRIQCDFNFKNLLGVCNSKLICYYLGLDRRLNSLMMIFKYWAKTHSLSGSSGRFTNYCLTMMFIFYLQRSPCRFPPVSLLQTPATTNIQDGWNGGFDFYHKYFSKALNEASATDIMYGFFEFYASFDYNLNIICPYLGTLIPKVEFLSSSYITDSLPRYMTNITTGNFPPLKIDSSACVQDPFEHNHNLAGSIPLRHLNEFVSCCKLGASIFKNRPVDHLALYNLLTFDIETLDMAESFNPNEESNFKITFNPKSLTYIISSKDKEVSIRNKFYELANQFVLIFLKNVLKLEITIKESGTNSKARKLDGQTDIHDNNVVDSVSFNCIAHYNTWDARKSISKDFKSSATLFIDQQISLSDYILNVLYKNINIKDCIVEFNIDVAAVIEPTEMQCHITKVNGTNKNFKGLAMYIYRTLPVWFDKYIGGLLVETNKDSKEESEPVG